MGKFNFIRAILLVLLTDSSAEPILCHVRKRLH